MPNNHIPVTQDISQTSLSSVSVSDQLAEFGPNENFTLRSVDYPE